MKVSVVIPCFNHGRYIDDALSDILLYPKQEDIEVIIVNDGSTDSKTIEKLNSLSYSNVRVLHQENQGLGKARNNGIKVAKNEIILALDSDNRIKTEFIDLALKTFAFYPDVAVVYSDQEIFNDNGFIRNKKVIDFDKNQLLLKNYIDACAFFRKGAWKEVEGYDENMPIMGFEDWDFWIRLMDRGFNFFHISKPLYCYRVVPGSMIKDAEKKQAILLEYMLKKNAAIWAKHVTEIGINYSYAIRKPFFYFLKRLVGIRSFAQ